MANMVQSKLAVIFIPALFIILLAGSAYAEPDAVVIPAQSSVKEKEDIRHLREQFSQARQLEKETANKLNAYKGKLTNHGNLLLSPTTRVKEIENAWAVHQASLDEITSQLKELAGKRDQFGQLLKKTEEQYDLNQKQLFEIDTESADTAETRAQVERLQATIRLLSEKIQYLEEIHEVYKTKASQIEETQKGFAELSGKFDRQIKEKKKDELFKRKYNPLLFLNLNQIREDINLFAGQIRLLISGNFWLNEFRSVRRAGGFLLVSCLLLFGLIQVLLFRIRSYCLRMEQEHSPVMQYPWRRLIIQLLNRSLLLLGTTVFLYSYANFRNIYSAVHHIRVVFYVLLIWLFTRWSLDFLKLWDMRKTKHVPGPMMLRLRILLFMIRYFAIFYVILEWVAGYTNFILFFGRVAFEITLLIWCILFWKLFREFPPDESILPATMAHSKNLPVVTGLSYAIISGGLVLEFAGYGSLALYWYKSWGISAILFLWAGLFFLLLFEWNRRFKESSAPGPDGSVKPSSSIEWLFIRVSWLAWFGAIAVGVLFAWGAKQAVIVGFFRILNKSFPIGGMSLSFLGFVLGFFILLCTHAAAHLWKHTLIEKFLAHSGLEPGVRESIKTISVYIIWLFGILISLNAVGVSSTSLTVGFGALGIGLGFGLQNIFNNFVSGIILLFERPIQVGDAVEVNGIWGEVKKINVRSTLVQTYDNASLIIPNSEFISNQVKNWSFKDPRVRRSITVGVAYGSDVKLVYDTLLEIADKIAEVYHYPNPNVIFTDFGESALIFQLRVWTHVNVCVSVETDIRFEIDQLFRERNIEIAFPQRDVHMYVKNGEL